MGGLSRMGVSTFSKLERISSISWTMFKARRFDSERVSFTSEYWRWEASSSSEMSCRVESYAFAFLPTANLSLYRDLLRLLSKLLLQTLNLSVLIFNGNQQIGHLLIDLILWVSWLVLYLIRGVGELALKILNLRLKFTARQKREVYKWNWKQTGGL